MQSEVYAFTHKTSVATEFLKDLKGSDRFKPAKNDELERQRPLGRKLTAGPWLGQFANPRLRKDLTAVQTRGVLTAPTHQSLTP